MPRTPQHPAPRPESGRDDDPVLETDDGVARPPRRRPVTLVVAVALLALQAGVFVALAIAVAVSSGGATSGSGLGADGVSYPVVVFAGVAGLLLAVVAVSLWRCRRWARGAAVAWSVLMVLVGLSQLQVNPAVALAVVVVAAACAAAAVAPATRFALDGADAGLSQD